MVFYLLKMQNMIVKEPRNVLNRTVYPYLFYTLFGCALNDNVYANVMLVMNTHMHAAFHKAL